MSLANPAPATSSHLSPWSLLTKWTLTLFCVAFAAISTPVARAQDNAFQKFQSGFSSATEHLNKKTYDTGLTEVTACISELEGTAKDEIGPVFGHLYYLKGIFHIRLNQLDEATTALRFCCETYANTPEALKKAKRPNNYVSKARAQLGAAYLANEKYGEAVATLERAMKESASEDKADISVNLARAYMKNGDIRGRQMLNSSLETAPTDRAKLDSFLILINDWARTAPLAQVAPFIDQHRPMLAAMPARVRLTANSQLLQMARKSSNDGDPDRAMVWFSLLTDPDRAEPSMTAELERLKAAGNSISPQLRAIIPDLEKEIADLPDQANAIQIERAAAYLAIPNYDVASILYTFLVERRPDLKERPLLMHNLLVSEIQREDWQAAADCASLFFQEFQEHELVAVMAQMYSDALYAKGDYTGAMAVASEQRDKFGLGTAEREPLDFNTGAALFQLGNFESAEREFDAFVDVYKKGARLEQAMFYRGATKVQLKDWDGGAKSLDSFCASFANSELRPTALYLSALCYLQADLLDPSLERATEITKKYPDAPEIAAAHNIRGDVLIGIGEAPVEEIIASFTRGREAAIRFYDAPAAAYALWQLTGLASFEKRWEDVCAHFDDFRELYPESPFEVEMLVASLAGLGERGRAHQAIDLLEKSILKYGDDATSPELSELFGTYAAYLREQIPAREVLQRLNNFPSEKPLSFPIQAWIQMAKIETKITMDPVPSQKELNEHYYRMMIDFEKQHLPNYCLLKLGRWHSEIREKPESSREVYEYIISERKGMPGYDFALFDIAALDAKSEDEQTRRNALTMMESLLAENAEPELIEAATVEIARLHVSLNQWRDARKWWNGYLKNRRWSNARAEANYYLAMAEEEEGNVDEALKLFISVYVNFPGQLKWSTDAYLRAAKILKAKGESEKALLILRDMIVRMRDRSSHPAVAEALDLFIKWRKEYELELKNKNG